MEKETMDSTNWLPILISGGALAISILSLFWNVMVQWFRRRANLEMWQRNDFFQGGDDDRTIINLLFRNKSHRDTAIIELYLRDEKGNAIEGHGYKGLVELPIKIKEWSVEKRSFRIEHRNEKEMKDILIKDIDDNVIIYDRLKGEKWVKSEKKKEKKKST